MDGERRKALDPTQGCPYSDGLAPARGLAAGRVGLGDGRPPPQMIAAAKGERWQS